ncbi:MAG TPA: VOC family protein [Anaeromyxobacter sp.]
MSERERYPPGVPCWVETLQPDPQAALEFYGPLFGWEFVGPGPMPGDPPGRYFVARLRGRDVAGIGSSTNRSGAPAPTWSTYVRVASAGEAAEKAKKAGGSVRDGPFDVLPAGRMAVLADPAGALVCVWEARARDGAQLVNEPRAWAMSVLDTTDPEGAKAFYGAVFGWQPESFDAAGARMTLWRLPGYVGGEPEQPVPRDVVGVMIAGEGSPGAAPPHWSVELWVDSADATAEHAARLGGKVIVPPHDTPGFRSAVVKDPQGAVFSVSNLRAGPQRNAA